MGKTRQLFRKIRDTKGTCKDGHNHAKMGTIKDRNGMDLTEAKEQIKGVTGAALDNRTIPKKISMAQITMMV